MPASRQVAELKGQRFRKGINLVGIGNILGKHHLFFGDADGHVRAIDVPRSLHILSVVPSHPAEDGESNRQGQHQHQQHHASHAQFTPHTPLLGDSGTLRPS